MKSIQSLFRSLIVCSLAVAMVSSVAAQVLVAAWPKSCE